MVSSVSVTFQGGAVDGEQSCITVTAICDEEIEGEEAVAVLFVNSMTFVRNDSGNGVTGSVEISIVDGTGE